VKRVPEEDENRRGEIPDTRQGNDRTEMNRLSRYLKKR
jgi:hypothetical protein